MKIFITSDGFVGSHLKRFYKNSLTNNIQNADIVINTIGILKEEKYTFEDSHINTVKNIIPDVKNKKFIHISALGSRLNHPSKYKHTKAEAEQIIKSHIKNYAIIKPSIIMGKGQKLYSDLERFKHLPVVFAPKMKVSPLDINDLIKLVDNIIKKDLKGEFEICGETVTMKQLFKTVFHSFNKNPLIIEMPKFFFFLTLPLLNAMNIMGKEEYLMIEDNICKEKHG